VEVKNVWQFPTLPKERSSSFRLAVAVLYKFRFMEDIMIELVIGVILSLAFGFFTGWLINNKLGNSSLVRAKES